MSLTQTSTSTETRDDSRVGHMTLVPQVSTAVAAFPELEEKGYTVVKGALTRERAAYHVDQAFAWLEGFELGFDRDDRSTWTRENLPAFHRGGMFKRHGIQHEQWVWDIRSEPGLIDVFGQIWGTDDLLVSFDAVNLSFPRTENNLVDDKPWPHVDQSPLKRDRQCIQGIMNLYEVGPLDGSLMVLDGSFPLFNRFFVEHQHQAPESGWSSTDFFMYTSEQLQWFYDRGCTWKKVEAGAGDVILWDSRTIHYGAHAEGDRPRVATYVCYKPAREASNEVLQKRQDYFNHSWGTSHDPINFRAAGTVVDGKLTKNERSEPVSRPVLSNRALRLVGLKP